ncbi:MAG: YitT family protein [Asticcacaulis sp.]
MPTAANPTAPPDKAIPDKDGADALYPVVKHTLIEDIYAFAIGCSFVVLGIVFLKAAGLVTGGVAGIALLLSYVVPPAVGVLFMLINIPFFLFAWPAMGKRFMIKDGAGQSGHHGPGPGGASGLSHRWRPSLVRRRLRRHHRRHGHPGPGAARRRRGGTGVLALYLQKRRGINAGKTQMLCDALILSVSLSVLNWHSVLYSLVSAVAMSGVLIGFHKPERYIGR